MVRLHRLTDAGDHRVVVAVADRVVFMVVAAGAADRHAEHARAERGHHVVELVVADRLGRLRRHLPRIRPGHEKPGGRRRGEVAGLDKVARHLHPQELVVGQVGVEGLDHPVAVVVGVGAIAVELVATAFPEPHRVEPVAGPALAELRAGQQPIDEPFVGVGRGVVEERLQFLGRRRQAREVEIHPADERGLGRLRGRCDPRLFLRGENEAVDIVSHPAGRGHLRRRHRREATVRPVPASRLDVDRPLVDGRERLVPRVGSPHVDPCLEVGDHLVGEFSGGGHLEAVVLERRQEEAVLLLARHHRGTAFPALGHASPGVHHQAGLERAGPQGFHGVALVAVLGEHGPDSRLEERDLLRRGRRHARA